MKRLFIAVVGSLLLVSCNDFLSVSPQSERSLDDFFQTPEDARSMVNTLYRSGATEPFYDTGGFNGSVAMMGGYIAGLFDNEAKGERIEPLRAQELTFTPVNLTGELGDWWAGAYNAIATANTAIQGIPDTDGLSESQANRLLAEARFFRAFNYFFLVKSFGGVPLITEPFSGLEGIFTERATAEEVYSQIISDLNWAIEQGGLNDVPFPMNGFRITRGAAATLLADVHLQRTGHPVQAADSYASAAEAARSVINSGAHALIENGSTVEESAYNVMRVSDSEPEYIYSIEYNAGISPNPAPRVSLPGDVRPPGIKYTRTLNVYQPLDEYVSIYDADKDLRIQNRQLFYTSIEHGGESFEFDEYVPYLFYDENAVFETARGDKNLSVYRYAEVLLIAAEAIARSEGVTAEAVGYLADVRDRAYWQTDRSEIVSDLSALSEQGFVEEVWKERYRELALSYKVWSDIQRTRLYPVAAEGEVNFVDVVGHTNPFGATYEEKYLLWPIPDTEMQRNPALNQNPGY